MRERITLQEVDALTENYRYMLPNDLETAWERPARDIASSAYAPDRLSEVVRFRGTHNSFDRFEETVMESSPRAFHIRRTSWWNDSASEELSAIRDNLLVQPWEVLRKKIVTDGMFEGTSIVAGSTVDILETIPANKLTTQNGTIKMARTFSVSRKPVPLFNRDIFKISYTAHDHFVKEADGYKQHINPNVRSHVQLIERTITGRIVFADSDKVQERPISGSLSENGTIWTLPFQDSEYASLGVDLLCDAVDIERTEGVDLSKALTNAGFEKQRKRMIAPSRLNNLTDSK